MKFMGPSISKVKTGIGIPEKTKIINGINWDI
jgi:hypothetical protein